MIVAKFGGTSVSSAQRIKTLCNIVDQELKRQPVVVVSALSGVTDLLLSLPGLPRTKLAKQIKEIRNIHQRLADSLFTDKKLKLEILYFIDDKLSSAAKLANAKSDGTLDKLASFGEIMSSYLITQALKNSGIKAMQVIATELIVTDNNFGSAEFILGLTKRRVKKVLTPLIKSGTVPVITGFIGSTKNGQTTTLGRGGSDYSASIIGFCLEALEIQIWTDVDGMFTADPRFFKNAKALPVVSFKEASELASFGARVLHPRTIKPAICANIPVKVLNTFNPKNPGTLIKEKIKLPLKLRAIAFKRKINLVNIYSTEMLLKKGFLARVFKIFANNNISIDLVSVSEVSISVTLDNDGSLEEVTKEISKFAKVSVIKDLGMVSLIGEGITSETKIIKSIFETLDKAKILARMVSLGATDINISIVIDSEKIEKAVKVLHNKLLE